MSTADEIRATFNELMTELFNDRRDLDGVRSRLDKQRAPAGNLRYEPDTEVIDRLVKERDDARAAVVRGLNDICSLLNPHRLALSRGPETDVEVICRLVMERDTARAAAATMPPLVINERIEVCTDIGWRPARAASYVGSDGCVWAILDDDSQGGRTYATMWRRVAPGTPAGMGPKARESAVDEGIRIGLAAATRLISGRVSLPEPLIAVAVSMSAADARAFAATAGVVLPKQEPQTPTPARSGWYASLRAGPFPTRNESNGIIEREAPNAIPAVSLAPFTHVEAAATERGWDAIVRGPLATSRHIGTSAHDAIEKAIAGYEEMRAKIHHNVGRPDHPGHHPAGVEPDVMLPKPPEKLVATGGAGGVGGGFTCATVTSPPPLKLACGQVWEAPNETQYMVTYVPPPSAIFGVSWIMGTIHLSIVDGRTITSTNGSRLIAGPGAPREAF